MEERVVRVERFVAAPPERIFELLANPARHAEIDGSSSVRHPRQGAPARLSHGARFGMHMRIVVPYRMGNTVVEFEEGRRIAWRQDMGHHVWRYELEPRDGGTLVRESFDWRTSRTPWLLRLMRSPAHNRTSMEKTLERLEKVV